MAKKYRLKINYSEITEENFDMVRELRKHDLDGNIVDDSMTILQFIKKSWLTEIKEPLTHGEWFKNAYPGFHDDSFDWKKDQVDKFGSTLQGWEACLKNQKLGQVVDEKNDYQEFLNFVKEHSTYSDIDTWKAALKHARGL